MKQAVTGYGTADKHQNQQMVKMLLDLPEIPKPDDAATRRLWQSAVCTGQSSTVCKEYLA